MSIALRLIVGGPWGERARWAGVVAGLLTEPPGGTEGLPGRASRVAEASAYYRCLETYGRGCGGVVRPAPNKGPLVGACSAIFQLERLR